MKSTFWAIVVGVFAPLLAGAAELRMPSQPLGTALQDLGTRAGVEISFLPAIVDGRQAPALNGLFTVEGALDTLLAGTGLTYHVLNTEKIEVLGTPIDEVEVTGSYQKLSAMLKEYEKVEDQFYELYNTLNTDPEYRVSCGESESHDVRRQVVLGGRRNCVPQFVERAQQQEARDLLDGHVPLSATLAVIQKTPAYQKHMTTLVAQNPKLLELLMKRSALEQRYTEVRGKKFAGGRVFVWD
jgi:hypothetical protein